MEFLLVIGGRAESLSRIADLSPTCSARPSRASQASDEIVLVPTFWLSDS
jgi:hypothetical protein